MSAAALLAQAEAMGVSFRLVEGALKFDGELSDELLTTLWPVRNELRELIAERDRERCYRCRASPGRAETGGADQNGWLCVSCLQSAGVWLPIENTLAPAPRLPVADRSANSSQPVASRITRRHAPAPDPADQWWNHD
ncbi:MAG: hypothetical protein WAS21_20490 [Geminicoccaceae bacterium]